MKETWYVKQHRSDKIVACCSSLEEAEAFIEDSLALADPQGVWYGDYEIDGPCFKQEKENQK